MPEWVHLGVGCIYPSLGGHSLIPCFLFRKYIVCGNCLVFFSNLTKTLKKSSRLQMCIVTVYCS